MNQRSLYPSISQSASSSPSFDNINTDEELLDVLAQIEQSRSQNYTAAASQASSSTRLSTPSSRTFPSSSSLRVAATAAATNTPAAASARAGVASASDHDPTPTSLSLYDELVRFQSEHGIQDENDADILEIATDADNGNATKSFRRSESSTSTSHVATAGAAATEEEEASVMMGRRRSELLNDSTHSIQSTSMHSTGTGSTTSDRKLPARPAGVVPAMSGATYRKPISRNLFSSSKKPRARRFSNGSVHDNGIDIDEINDYHPGKLQPSASPSAAPPPSVPYGDQRRSSMSTRSTSMGSTRPMPMHSETHRQVSLPSQPQRQISSISDPGDDHFSSEWYGDNNNDHDDHMPPLPPAVAREQSSLLDQDEELARRLQDEYEGLSRHHTSSAMSKSDEALSRQMEELIREQEQNEREPVRTGANSHSHGGQQQQYDHQQQQRTSFTIATPKNSNSSTAMRMMESDTDDEGMMKADEIEEQRRILMQIEKEQQARKQHRTSLVTTTRPTERRSLTTAAPTAARNTTMSTRPAGDFCEAEEQFRILERIREEQEREELAQALNLSRQTSPSSPPPPPSSMAVGGAHGNRRPSFPGVGATWEAYPYPNPQRSSISGGGPGAGSAAESLQSQHAAMTEYERRGVRPDPNARSTGNVHQRSQSLTLPVDCNHNQQQYSNDYSRTHPSNTNQNYHNTNQHHHNTNQHHHHHHNNNSNSYLNSHSSSHHSSTGNHHHSQQHVFDDDHIDDSGDESHHHRQDMVRRGLVETQRAVQEGRAHVVRCQGCGERLHAPVHYSLVYCPTCGVISPGQSAHDNNSYSGSSPSGQRRQSFHHEGHSDNSNNNSYGGSSPSGQRRQSFHHEGHNERWR